MKSMWLIVLLVLSLSGCRDYPGHQPTVGAVQLVPKPLWGDVVSPEISSGGDCHIDSINDNSGEGAPSHTVSQSGTVLKVAGWGAISAKDGVLASDIAVALKSKSPENTRFFAQTTKEKRQDVADYFKNPASIDTGFRVMIDLFDVSPGEYVLEVIQYKDGKILKCQHTANIIIE